MTRRFAALVAVPSTVVTLILAVVAAEGMVKVICAGALVTIPAGTTSVPTLTVGATTPTFKFVPSTVTLVTLPATTLAGAKPVIFGNTLKITAVAPVPAGLVTWMGPVSAPAGTTALSDVAVTAVGVTLTPPVNATDVASTRLVPLIVTTLATAAPAGTNVIGFGG
jgi:hypothetical protein